MNNKGYVYFIEIIISVIFVVFLLSSLKPTTLEYEVEDEFSKDILYILYYQDLLKYNLNKTDSFESYINDSLVAIIGSTKDFEINYNTDETSFSNGLNKVKSDISQGYIHSKNLNDDWYTINLYTWSKI